MEPVIETKDLGKCYRLYGDGYARIKEALSFGRRKFHQEVWALRGVNLSLPAGSTVGVVGPNGAGKSTLLKILTGTTFPSHGSYRIKGKVASLLELGAGFHQYFTGRENIYMNAAMMGFSRAETDLKFQQILDFSELHNFIDAPIRTYSSGMIARLGFSAAISVEPDVLIIDEILAVGDMHFQKKCVERIWDFKNRGKTVLFCSHSLYDVRQLCDHAIWIQDGNVQLIGDAITVTNEYATYEKKLIGKEMDYLKGLPGRESKEPDSPHVVDAKIIDARTAQPRNIFKPGEAVDIVVRFKNAKEPIPLTLGIGFTRTDTTLCFAHTTEMDGVRIGGSEGTVTLHLPAVKLLSGEFVVFVWVMDATGVHRYHQAMCDRNLVIQNRGKEVGLFLQDHSWTVTEAGGLDGSGSRAGSGAGTVPPVVDLSLLVVSYNTIELAANMLYHLANERLVHADGRPLSWEWVVVDNASPRKDPGGIAVLRDLAARVPGRLVEHTENPGYAGGMNLAYEHSKGELVLVLNPDMIFEAGCVNRLVAWMERHPETGAVGPKGFWDPEYQVMLPPNILPTIPDLAGVTAATLFRRLNRSYSMRRTRAAVPVWRSREPVELPMLSGCCFLMRRTLIREIGFFDGRFPLYFEDTDLFLRIAKAGRKMFMLPDARLVHLYNRSGVTNQTEAMRRYWVSRQLYYEKWYGTIGDVLFLLSRKASESAFAKRRVALPMDEISDLGKVEAPPTLVFPRCEQFVLELAQDPCFLLAGGIMGEGDRWTPGRSLWAMMADSTYFFRGIDLSGGGFRHMGTWSFTPVRGRGGPGERAPVPPAPYRAEGAAALAGGP